MNLQGTPNRGGCFGTFDPAPLLRLLELSLPDTRETPLETPPGTRQQNGYGRFDDGRKRVYDRQIAEALGVSRKTVQRWRHGALLRWYDADRFAVRAGVDAALLWPDDWYAVEWDDEQVDQALAKVQVAS